MCHKTNSAACKGFHDTDIDRTVVDDDFAVLVAEVLLGAATKAWPIVANAETIDTSCSFQILISN